MFLAVPTAKAPMAAAGILWEDGDGWQSLTYRLQEQHSEPRDLGL